MELLDVHIMQSKMSFWQRCMNSCVVPTTVRHPVQYVWYPCHNKKLKVMKVSTDQAMAVMNKHTCHDALRVTTLCMLRRPCVLTPQQS